MAGKSPQTSVWELVRRQHGVIARRQLLELGYTKAAIEHRVAGRRLHPVRRGVYAVGRRELTQYGDWMAAVLFCGDEAVLSYWDAARLWEIRMKGPREIHISMPANVDRKGPGIRPHRVAILIASDLTTHRGIPVTSPIRTLIDLATVLDRDQLEAAINEADKRRLTNPEELREALEGRGKQPGVAKLRSILDRRTFVLTESQLERCFLPIARSLSLPKPQTQVKLNGGRVDFYWPDLGLVIETDGLQYHRTPAQQAKDRRRDQAHAAAGLTPLRFTHGQIRFEREHVRDTLGAVARRLGHPFPPWESARGA